MAIPAFRVLIAAFRKHFINGTFRFPSLDECRAVLAEGIPGGYGEPKTTGKRKLDQGFLLAKASARQKVRRRLQLVKFMPRP